MRQRKIVIELLNYLLKLRRLNITRFHILQGQALTISSYKFSSRREFTFIFFSLRRGDDRRVREAVNKKKNSKKKGFVRKGGGVSEKDQIWNS